MLPLTYWAKINWKLRKKADEISTPNSCSGSVALMGCSGRVGDASRRVGFVKTNLPPSLKRTGGAAWRGASLRLDAVVLRRTATSRLRLAAVCSSRQIWFADTPSRVCHAMPFHRCVVWKVARAYYLFSLSTSSRSCHSAQLPPLWMNEKLNLNWNLFRLARCSTKLYFPFYPEAFTIFNSSLR